MVKVQIGDVVNFVDREGKYNNALVTEVWGIKKVAGTCEWDENDSTAWPALNVVIISRDDTKGDCYGRQIERETSITPKCRQIAPGFYWEFLTK